MASRKKPALITYFLTILILLPGFCGPAWHPGSTVPVISAAPPRVEDCQTYPETGFTTCGRFLEYWQTNGGLTRQGFPISGVFEELNLPPPAGDGKLHKVQYFQRARFEEHSENAAPYDVLLGLLGTEQFEALPATGPASSRQPGICQYFKETGLEVCGRFLEYWQANGGLSQLGYPVSGFFNERNQAPPAGDGKIHRVQYFQRARFEEHLENNPPSDVLLGLLGTEQYKKNYPSTQPSLPTPPAQVPPDITLPPAPHPPGGGGPLPPAGCLPETDGAKKTMVEVCTDNTAPAPYSNVAVYGRLVVNGIPANTAKMDTTWNFATAMRACSGTASGDGVASCTINTGNTSPGYTVVINVRFSYNGQVYTTTTSFTTG
jgi:hypothetical protein